MLLPRILTAVVGIPLVLFLIHWGGLSFSFFVVIISILCLYEYGVILHLGNRPVQRISVLVLGALLSACTALGIAGGAALAASMIAVFLVELFSRQHSLERAALSLFGILGFGFLPAHIALIRNFSANGEKVTFLLFIAVWAMDSTAYAVGKTMGRTKLASNISPKKTWEGFIAGVIAAIAVVFAFRAATPSLFSAWRAIAVGLAIGIGGTLSDLAESLIKRSVGAKDSGALLPGHGGVMDRFDAFLFCAPAVYYLLAF